MILATLVEFNAIEYVTSFMSIFRHVYKVYVSKFQTMEMSSSYLKMFIMSLPAFALFKHHTPLPILRLLCFVQNFLAKKANDGEWPHAKLAT